MTLTSPIFVIILLVFLAVMLVVGLSPRPTGARTHRRHPAHHEATYPTATPSEDLADDFTPSKSDDL